MKITQRINLRVEDFPGEQSWIGRLFNQLNPFIQSVNTAFDNNTDFDTNIKSVTKAYSINSVSDFEIAWPFKVSPVDLRITKALKGIQKTPTVLLASWDYDASTNLITVYNLLEASSSGILQASGAYNFIVRATI